TSRRRWGSLLLRGSVAGTCWHSRLCGGAALLLGNARCRGERDDCRDCAEPDDPGNDRRDAIRHGSPRFGFQTLTEILPGWNAAATKPRRPAAASLFFHHEADPAAVFPVPDRRQRPEAATNVRGFGLKHAAQNQIPVQRDGGGKTIGLTDEQ